MEVVTLVIELSFDHFPKSVLTVVDKSNDLMKLLIVIHQQQTPLALCSTLLFAGNELIWLVFHNFQLPRISFLM